MLQHFYSVTEVEYQFELALDFQELPAVHRRSPTNVLNVDDKILQISIKICKQIIWYTLTSKWHVDGCFWWIRIQHLRQFNIFIVEYKQIASMRSGHTKWNAVARNKTEQWLNNYNQIQIRIHYFKVCWHSYLYWNDTANRIRAPNFRCQIDMSSSRFDNNNRTLTSIFLDFIARSISSASRRLRRPCKQNFLDCSINSFSRNVTSFAIYDVDSSDNEVMPTISETN